MVFPSLFRVLCGSVSTAHYHPTRPRKKRDKKAPLRKKRKSARMAHIVVHRWISSAPGSARADTFFSGTISPSTFTRMPGAEKVTVSARK